MTLPSEIALVGQYCRQPRQPTQFVPIFALPFTTWMFSRGQIFAHWPQPMHLSLTLNFLALSLRTMGHALFSAAFRKNAPGSFVLSLPAMTFFAICFERRSERFWAAFAPMGGTCM